MKREDIEKAAKDYSIGKTHFRRNVLKEVDADDYVLRKDNCCEDFMAGAEWRINSVWYDAREKPDKGKCSLWRILTVLMIWSIQPRASHGKNFRKRIIICAGHMLKI